MPGNCQIFQKIRDVFERITKRDSAVTRKNSAVDDKYVSEMSSYSEGAKGEVLPQTSIIHQPPLYTAGHKYHHRRRAHSLHLKFDTSLGPDRGWQGGPEFCTRGTFASVHWSL